MKENSIKKKISSTGLNTGGTAKEHLRLWIRLLRTTRTVEREVRERLKTKFNSTLPRFDVLAALFRHQPKGMLMSELSAFLVVSNGNVTGIVDRLVDDGYIARALREGDRRTSIVNLTSAGEKHFRAMAVAHENWIAELLGDVSLSEAKHFSGLLKSIEIVRNNHEHI